jgi:hypothetical protein
MENLNHLPDGVFCPCKLQNKGFCPILFSAQGVCWEGMLAIVKLQLIISRWSSHSSFGLVQMGGADFVHRIIEEEVRFNAQSG